jgi:N-acetylneuraminic acid mutarotase
VQASRSKHGIEEPRFFAAPDLERTAESWFAPNMEETSMRGLTIFTLISLLIFVAMLKTSVPAQAQSSRTWAATGTLNFPRVGHTATLLANGQVLVAGGEDSQGNHIAAAELYNPTTGKWTVSGSLETPRIDHTATLLANGEVLVAGGVDTTYTATAEVYSPLTGQWTATGSMTISRAFAAAAMLGNGEVLMAGGSNLDGTSSATAELYNPATGKWAETTDMSGNHTSAAILLPSGEVLVVGGGGVIYDPSTAQWTETGALYYDLMGGSVAPLRNGDVLVYGNKFSCYAGQFYDSKTNTWARTVGQCGNDISAGPLVSLGTGKVLIAGDEITYSGHTSPTTRCALYDPSTNTWTPTGSLLAATRRTATLLPSRKVLSVGGSDAELYTP